VKGRFYDDEQKDRNGPTGLKNLDSYRQVDHIWTSPQLACDDTNIGSTTMSQNETSSESPNGNLPKLAELARQAYEQKRTKDCLDLTRAILLIDPDNADAQWMRSSIQSVMQRDLENARAFLRQAHSGENPEHSHESETADLPDAADADSLLPVPDSSRMPGTRWLVGATVLIIAGVVIASLPRFRSKSNAAAVSAPALSASGGTKPLMNANAVQQAELSPAVKPAELEIASTPATLPVVQPAAAPGRESNPAPAPRPSSKVNDRPVVAPGSGTLAVSSPTSVDIYKDDAYLGSVPISLELPAGAQTLEYRHGSLRRNITHIINSNETTRAMITFDVNVQVNSRPWAEVFIDGIEKKSLGQTPLSGVRVPIGSVLVFENPQFQAKKYRVTGNETGIQIVFP